MNSFFLDESISSSFVDTIKNYWSHLFSYVTSTFLLFRENNQKNWLSFFETFSISVYFDDFQLKLLKGFLLLLCVNVVLICIAWKIYGKKICERFMKPATAKAIEELRASVSKLKLPKEHSPRV